MFDNLIVSNPQKRGFKDRAPQSVLSLAIHGALIYGAITATMKGAELIEEAVADTTMVFLEQAEEEPEPEPEQEEIVAVVTRLDPPPQGFQTLTAPIDIPTEIPPIDLNERFDPRDFTGRGVEGGIFEGVVGGTGVVDQTQTFLSAVVDERPEPLSCPVPAYPPLLQQAGISGTVLIQAVVDTLGRIDPNDQFRILSSDHRGFERPAREAILRCRFRPGKVRGRPVRVLINQPYSFGIGG